MRRSFHRRRRSGSPRRKDWQSNSNWENVPGTITPGTLLLSSYWIAFPADTFGEVAGANNQIEQEEDNTIVRLLTAVTITFHTATASSGGAVFAGAGIIRWAQNTQDTPNPLEIPNPIIDADADWLWSWSQARSLVGIPADTFTTLTNFVSPDSLQGVRSKRKLSSKQGLLFIACVDNSFGLQNVDDFSYTNWTRFLVLLP